MGVLSDKFEQQFGDDPENVETEGAFSGRNLDLPLKPGEYLFKILNEYTKVQDTSGGGEQLNLQLEVQGPESEGRMIFPRFQIDCPKNREFQEEEQKRILEIWRAAGEQGYPDVKDLPGCTFIGRTDIEFNDYEEGSYESTLWDVAPVSDGPPSGSWDDEDQPEIWFDAVEHAKENSKETDDSSSGGGGSAGSGGKTKSFDDDDLNF